MVSPSTDDAAGRPLVGIALVVAATLAFGVSDILTKHLSTLYPVPVVMAVRYLANLLLLAVFPVARPRRPLVAGPAALARHRSRALSCRRFAHAGAGRCG